MAGETWGWRTAYKNICFRCSLSLRFVIWHDPSYSALLAEGLPSASTGKHTHTNTDKNKGIHNNINAKQALLWFPKNISTKSVFKIAFDFLWGTHFYTQFWVEENKNRIKRSKGDFECCNKKHRQPLFCFSDST